jgi:hypothetical protein
MKPPIATGEFTDDSDASRDGGRPDFSGSWEMNAQRSVLRGPPPKRLSMRIDHRGPTLIQDVLTVGEDGAEQRASFRYICGAETLNAIGTVAVRTTARWAGSALVIESWIAMPGREIYYEDHWSLADDGRTITMAHHNDDLEGQITVLERRD